MTSFELGPIWRSLGRHRGFTLLIVEVAFGFFIVGNLLATIRWYASKALPPTGHREDDVVEVVSRRPAREPDDARLGELRRREHAALVALPDVRAVAAVSSTQIDDRWSLPLLFWSEPGTADGPSRCAGVARAADGIVVGWDVAAEPTLGEVLDLRAVAGTFFGPGPHAAPDSVVVTRCLAEALFGGAPDVPVLGRTLLSNRRPPARIVGVIEDVRLRMASLYQTHVTAIYPLPPDDARVARWVLRTAPGRAPDVRVAVTPALAPLDTGEGLVTARLFVVEETISGNVAWGTAIILGVVGGSLGVLAVLGQLAAAAFLGGDRRRVIGVRRALGATRWDVVRTLLLESLIPTQLGSLLGLLVVLATLPAVEGRFAGLRFGVLDALATALLLSVGGVLAKLLPALHATRIPPSEVTRSL